GDAAPPGAAAAGAAGGLAATADIPVGGGKVFKAEKVVVTQPAEGEFKAFDAICTHKQCPVGSVSDGSIICPCHNSRFSITDGSVQSGPAEQALAEKPIKVEAGTIALA
ncbi:Rieske (2Fe-2S) protein, partial [Sphaerisporangium rubeum]|uniref:Rieske (2Fe-2S) protein n=1 Tax=Sphaerisporangium rubeum TaxID=321317 RepID=UPI0031D0FB3F